MAVKTYLVSFEHEFIDGDSINFDKTATESALASAGATLDAGFDHAYVGMYKFDIDDSNIGSISSIAGYSCSENVPTKQMPHYLLVKRQANGTNKE